MIPAHVRILCQQFELEIKSIDRALKTNDMKINGFTKEPIKLRKCRTIVILKQFKTDYNSELDQCIDMKA